LTADSGKIPLPGEPQNPHGQGLKATQAGENTRVLAISQWRGEGEGKGGGTCEYGRDVAGVKDVGVELGAPGIPDAAEVGLPIGQLVGDIISWLPEVAGLRIQAQRPPLAKQVDVLPGQGSACSQ
jgi:hypothetical protein